MSLDPFIDRAEPAEPSDLALSIFLARLHNTASLTFWREDDWGQIHGVAVQRLDPETVTVSHRLLGRGHLAI